MSIKNSGSKDQSFTIPHHDSLLRAHSLLKMATISLKISMEGGAVVKTMQFDPSTTVYDACQLIREKILEANAGDPKEYGLFLTSDEESKKGIWLEPSRTLDYYILRNGDLLEYNKKTRPLRVRMLDGTVKTLLVDDSQIVANLMVVICTKIGITNYDEYGLVREDQKDEPDPCDRPNYGTLTLKRRHQEKERDAKMDQLRKKLRTDDEVNWVEPSKTLREQGVEMAETLLLRRRLFFSDRNVDSRDPVQLNLLYVQARDAILAGTHPITQDKACEFAGIQCQIQFGDHKEDKHTTGFLELNEFLAASYVKVKGIEKKVLKEHRRHSGLTELEAKVLYTKNARSLKTYGVAFFLVKEKMKGKNKLVPRLLGVSKDCVLRLDEKTKEILQSWPLTTVRRWCASPNTFTLDFGDYSDQYYSVQTTEAEQILQVIAGYIDIILRKQRAKDHLGIEGDEGSAMLEDSVSPSKANIIQHDTFKSGKVNTESVAKPAVLRPGAEGAKPFAMTHTMSAQQTTISGQIITGHAPPNASQSQQTRISSLQTEPQRALLSTITTGREVIEKTEMELTRAPLPPLGTDSASIKWKSSTLDSSRQLVSDHIAAMNAATAQVVTLTAGPEVDHTAVGAAITTIATNLPEMSKGVQMIAALMDDSANGDKLLDATRKLCSAFTDLLTAAEPETREPRKNLLNAASRVGEASTSVLYTIGEDNEEDKETQDILLSLAKAVATTTAALVLKAKAVATNCKDQPQLENSITVAATHCALATSQLVACAKVVAPTLSSAACREQLSAAARQVALAVEKLLEVCGHQPGSEDVHSAARQVTDALAKMVAHCDYDATLSPPSVQSVVAAHARLSGAAHSGDLVRHAHSLGQATARLITDIKLEAEKQPSEMQRKLLSAAKLLADATAKLVEAARQCASAPQDTLARQALLSAAQEVRSIASSYGVAPLPRLQAAARAASPAALQLTALAAGSAHAQENLASECQVLTSCVPRLVEATKQYGRHPDQPAVQLELMSSAEAFLQPASNASSAVRSVIPTIEEPSMAKALGDAAHRLTTTTTELRSALYSSKSSSQVAELDAAADVIRGLQQQVRQLGDDYQRGQLAPLPGETWSWARQQMSVSARTARSHAAGAAASARAQDAAAAHAHAVDLHAPLASYTRAMRAAVADQCPEKDAERILSSGSQLLESSLTLVETVKTYISTSETVHIQEIINSSKEVSEGLERTLAAVPSQVELERALEELDQTLTILDMNQFPQTERTYESLQSSLNSAAAQLSSEATNVAESQPAQLGQSSQHFGEAFNRLCGVTLELAGLTEDEETRTVMVSSMKTVTVNSSKLLSTAKSVSQDLTRPNAKNELAAAARAVTESINRLVDACSESSPGQKECQSAIRSIASTRPLLDAPSQPLLDANYYATLDQLVDQSKLLSEGMSGMAGSVKSCDGGALVAAVRTVAAAVTGLVECAAHAAYLVAVSEPSSVSGRAGLVDQTLFARASTAIDHACRTLQDRNSTQQQVLSAATSIAKHTSALANACRSASYRSTRAAHKRHFVQAAKDVANGTSALVKEIKALDRDYSQENRARCAALTLPVLEAVRGLCEFASGEEFASVPARISPSGRRLQGPLLGAGRDIISSSCSMVEMCRGLALNPQERGLWQGLADHSKTVSDSIKALVANMRELAPGQQQCASCVSTLEQCARDVDEAALTHHQGGHGDFRGVSEQIENSANELMERVEPLRVAAKSEAENLGHNVMQISSYAEALTRACCSALQCVGASAGQSLAAHCRTVLEALGQLARAAAAAGGNPRATSAHPSVDEHASSARRALEELVENARECNAQIGAVQPLVDWLGRAAARITENRMSLIGSYDENDSFVDYQTRMVGTAKEIAKLATDMTAKSATDASRLLQVGNDLCQRYERLATDSVGASATTPNADVANRIRTAVVELGESASSLIKAGGACRLAPGAPAQRAVADNARDVVEKVALVLGALQSGSRGTQACIDAAATIGAIVQELDTTILFASAGTLHSEHEGDTFSSHREGVLKTAKALVEDTKRLVAGAAASQDQLADAAHSAVSTIVQLCEVVKQGAMSLGSSNPEPQVLLLNAARDVAAALRDLAVATKGASGKHVAHPDMDRLKNSAKRADSKRWSMPVGNATLPRLKRRSVILRHENSCDSETDVYQSDMEEELLRLLDYSSQDDDISPSVFHDNCEEVITYIEGLMRNPTPREIKDSTLNERYNIAARNSLVNMDWRVLKYGENIFLGEVKKLVDLYVETAERVDTKRMREKINKLKANDELDNEMKRLSQVIEDIDVEYTKETVVTKIKPIATLTPKRPKLEEKILKHRLKNPTFKIKKVKPINLVVNLELINAHKQPKNDTITPVEMNKDEATEIVVKPKVVVKNEETEFWKMFKVDSELWKGLAKRNIDKMEEARRELERFSGHELVLGEIQNEMNKFDEQKQTLQTFIDEVDSSRDNTSGLQYNKKYEDIVLKLIEFARKDFDFKGFDPIIERLKQLSKVQIERPQNVYEITHVFKRIDTTKYTYDELVLLEKYYKDLIKKYKNDSRVQIVEIDDKENILPRESVSPRPIRENSPSYHKNVILNIHSHQNLTKNTNQYTIERNKNLKETHTQNNQEIFDLTRTYPMQYYANNWWSIYEGILKNREEQFGSLDNWWQFYEAMLKKGETNDEELNRIRAVVQSRCRLSHRPSSRMAEQLKMIDEVKRHSFQETEEVTSQDNDSVMVTNVTSLLKTVKAVEDEHTRGTRALESTIEAISQEIDVLMSPSPPKSSSSPEELIRFTRLMTAATTRAVSAGNSSKQDQLTAAANLGRKTVVDLLMACKGAAHSAETDELRARTLSAGREAALAYRSLLSAVLLSSTDAAARGQLPDLSRRVAHAVADIIAAAEMLKGSDWVDPDDPTVIAENELLGAAASIDAAAKKLDSLRPRKAMQVQEADESLNFDEMILEAARSIITATSALVRAASAAQRELIDQGKVARRPTSSSDDGQWSEGLVSAARLVAAAAHALVEAANALVQGAGSEERLISAARQVASSTAQLLVACKVKADPSSDSTKRLQSAGAEVIRSTDNLVRAARDSIAGEDERSLVLNRRMVGGIAQEIDARSDVLRIEKELDDARARLNAIRQAKYRLRGDGEGDDTDTDGERYNKQMNSSFANTTYSPNSTPYSQNATGNTTGLSQHMSQLNQSIHGNQSPGYAPKSPGYQPPASPGYNQGSPGFNQGSPGYNQGSAGYNQSGTTGYNQSTTFAPSSPGYNQSSTGYSQQRTENTQNGSYLNQTQSSQGYSSQNQASQGQSVQSPTFSSFRPQEQQNPKQNYEGFTTRVESEIETTVVVKSLRLPEVRSAELVTDDSRAVRRAKPAPPPRKATITNYETRLFDTPRPSNNQYTKTEERNFQSSHYHSKQEQKFGYDTPKLGSPISPKFNARDLKFDEKDSVFSTPKSPQDGVGQKFVEHQKSSEVIPGGTKHSEYTVKSESYQSYPKAEFKSDRLELKSPFATSTPSKFDKEYSTDLVKAITPDYDRISSPYGKDVTSYGGPNFREETTTEVKEIPNGTQKITMTKIYSSSPVNLTTTNTKYEPVKLEGIDELSKSFDNDSKYSTIDSRFSTLDSKMSSDTSKSFMRPSDFQSDFQTSTTVTKLKPTELTKELEGLDKKFSKQTITSETVERKSVMTSSHKSETSSTVTKKFGNFK